MLIIATTPPCYTNEAPLCCCGAPLHSPGRRKGPIRLLPALLGSRLAPCCHKLTLIGSRWQLLGVLATRYAIPCMNEWRRGVAAGALISYAPSLAWVDYKVGRYTGRILSNVRRCSAKRPHWTRRRSRLAPGPARRCSCGVAKAKRCRGVRCLSFSPWPV
jgi:hypothetical protein